MIKRCSLLGLLCIFICASSAWGDAAIESFTKFGGFKGNGAYEGTSITKFKGDKKSDTSSIKFTGAILSWVAPETDKVNITRLDKGVEWSIDPKKKTYTEIALTTFKPEDTEKLSREEKSEKSKVRITKSEFTVKKTGKSEKINGFSCAEYLVSWLLEMENTETKEKTSNVMETSLWTTPETSAIKKLQAEEMVFTKAYMKKIGLKMKPEEMKQFGMSMLAMSGASEKELEKGFANFKKEMAKVKGYSIRTVVVWKVEGDKPAAAQKEDASENSEPTDISNGIGGLLSGIIGERMKSGLKADANAPFFSSTVEVKSISASSLPADTFDIPAGYTLTK
jgi:hypothetical protein